MATITLNTTGKKLGDILVNEGSSTDRFFRVYGYYSKGTGANVDIYVKIEFRTTSTVIMSGKLGWQLGSTTATTKSFSNQTFGTSTYGVVVSNKISATYPDTGVFGEKTLKVSLTNMSGTWGAGDNFDCTPTKSAPQISVTVTLPNIDPKPTLAWGDTGFANQLDGLNVAGYTKISQKIDYTDCKVVKYAMTANSATTTYTLLNKTDKVYSGTAEKNNVVLPAAEGRSGTYTLTLKGTGGNDYFNASNISNTYTVYKYSPPAFNSASTYTRRCRADGTEDPQGGYGLLYLKWVFNSINSKNSMQSITAKLNGAVMPTGTVVTGSIAAGYIQWIFPLATTEQGDLTITLTDKVSSNVITSFSVPRAIVPFSMYQSGDNTAVGCAVGAMAVNPGFWVYTKFYLKSEDSDHIYQIMVHDDGSIDSVRVS